MKKIGKKLAIGISLLLVVVMAISTFQSGNVQEAEASTRLHGIQQIVDNLDETDKFLILEIVPDKAYSSLGYYVSGSEPNLDVKLIQRLLTYDTKTIDTNSVEGYLARKTSVLEYLAPIVGANNAVQYSDSFVYTEQLYATENMTGWNMVEATEGNSFSDIRKGYFELASDHGATYGDYDFVPDPDGATTTGPDGEVIPVGTYTYNPGNGDYIWYDSSQGSLQVVQFQKMYYRVAVNSNDWFAKNVLELGEDVVTDGTGVVLSHNVEVVSYTPAELEDLLNSTSTDALSLAQVDMIYISNSSCLALPTDVKYASYDKNVAYLVKSELTNDITWETAYNIYEYVVNSNMPVVIDDPIVSSTASPATLVTANNNMVRLSYLLKDFDTDITMQTYNLPALLSVDPATRLTEDAEKVGNSKVGTQGRVEANVYVNKSGVNLVNSGFSTTIFTKVVGGEGTYEANVVGTDKVVNEIGSENYYYNLEDKETTTEYVYDETGNSQHIVNVSRETFVKYILNYRNRRIEIYKDKITVLDIEPTKYSQLTEQDIRDWLGTTTASQKIKEIEIVQMTTAEFNCKIEDLNEEYDLIYFGNCIGPSNKTGSMDRTTSGSTVTTDYSDNNMDGLIYSHIGDKVTLKFKFGGLLDKEYQSSTILKSDSVSTRFSGNDLTENTVNKLNEFVASGYPVVIASDFYSGSQINTARVDSNSCIYDFMTTNLSANNVMKEQDSQIPILAYYINMAKLNLSIISAPTEYAITYTDNNKTKIQSVDYLAKTGNKYVLTYSFEFSNTSESNANAYNYQAELFIDTNADGQYADTEKLDALTIYETLTLKDVNVNELKPNVRYTVQRELPDDYVGILPWQLKISRVEANNAESIVRASAKGYTAIKANNTVVKVLQIASTQFRDAIYLKDFTEDNKSYSGNTYFETLFADMKTFMGFDIQIDVVSVNKYVSTYNNYISTHAGSTVEDFYNSYYKDYDMIILGFEDCYSDIPSANAVKAIDMFIASGRSVLFSHDTTSYFNVDYDTVENSGHTENKGQPYYHWGYHLNQYIRSDVGMDRYGVTDDELVLLKQGKATTNIQTLGKDGTTVASGDTTKELYTAAVNRLNKDIAYSPNKTTSNIKQTADAGVHGLTNGVINWDNSYNNTNIHYESSAKNYNAKNITQTNKGQITTYPYDLNVEDGDNSRTLSNSYYAVTRDKLAVSKTHPQYYQLDMNMDKDGDGDSDIVVWYCLADNGNDAFPNDGRNNYYIYSVGNITYTGMGHFQGASDTGLGYDEAKLFVNTIIASLDSGKKTPTISIVADANNKATSLEYIYRTYDTELGLEDSENVNLNFYGSDMNIVNGSKKLLVKYYYEVPKATYDKEPAATRTETKDSSGNTIYLIQAKAGEVDGVVDMQNETMASCTISGTWLNSMVKDATTPFKLYVSVQTEITYNQTDGETELTPMAFDYVTFKQRTLFNLD